MAEKLTAQTAAVGGDVSDDDLLYLVDDPSGTPTSKKITVATLMQAAAVRELLLDYLGDTVWQSGGGITVTHSDGGNTLTLGATGVLEDLNTLGASTTDGEFLVATGAGTLAWESGATARTSIGLGSVEDTALSTWAGTANVTTLGTIGTGTWQGTAIANAYVAGIDQNLLTSSSPTFTGLTLSADLVTTSTIDGVDIAALSSAYTTHAASDGSDHTFIDQSVVSGATPTFTATNITGVPAASILAGTFGTGNYAITGTLTASVPTATDDLLIGVISNATTFNMISFNGVDTRLGKSGIVGGGGFSDLYYDVPTGSIHTFRVNEVGVLALSSSTATFYGGPTITSTTVTATTLVGTLSTATQNSVTTMTGLASVGTITSGTWQGTAIDSAYIDQTLSVSTLTTTGVATVGGELTVEGDGAASLYTHTDATHVYITDEASGTGEGIAFGSGISNLLIAGSTVLETTASTATFYGGPTITSTTVTATTLNGTLGTAAQPNVTSVGTLTGLTVNGALDLAANGDVLTFTDTGNECRIVWDATGANAALVGNESMYVLIDANNDQTTRGFLVGHNATTPGAATVLFKVLEDGITTVNEDLALTTGSITSASGAIDFGNENLSTTGTGAFGTTTITSTAFNAGLKVIGSATTGSGVTLQSTDTGGREFQVFATGSISTPGLGLAIYDDTSNAYRMFVDASGNFDFYSGTITTTGAISGGAGSGFGIAPTDGTLHVHTASAGAVTALAGSSLVVEDSGTTYISLLSADAQVQGINFGDASDNDVGYIRYFHSNNSMRLAANTADNLTLSGASGSELGQFAGKVGIGVAHSEGTLHVHTASAGAVTAYTNANDLVVENSTHGGISVLTPDASTGWLVFGNPSDSVGASVSWDYTTSKMYVSSGVVGASLVLRGDDSVANLTLSGASGSELATFAGDVTLSAGVLNIDGGAASETIRNHADTGVSPYNSWYYDGARVGYLQAQNGDFELASDNGDTLTLKASGRMDFYANGSEVARFDTSDNFLLGATSTSSNAQFYATKTYSNASGTDLGSYFNYTQNTAGGSLIGQRITSDTSHTSGTVALSYGLQILNRALGAGSTTTTQRALIIGTWGSSNATATVGTATAIYIPAATKTGTVSAAWPIYSASTDPSYLAGDLRIGTTSATGTEQLKVYAGSGDAEILLAVNGSGNDAILAIDNLNTGSGAEGVVSFRDGGTERGAIRYLHNSGGDTDVMTFRTSATERVRIASDAYAIGIATTDLETWSASYGVVEFGATAIMANKTTASMHTLVNAYYDGAWKYKKAGAAATVEALTTGEWTWQTAASGTIDTAITWSEKMRLTNAGMVLIGDTANANMTVGLTINQGANDDEAFCLKSSDISHGYSSGAETDTWLAVKKLNATTGGAAFNSYTEDAASSTAMQFASYGGTADTAKTSSGLGLVTVYAAEHDGANAVADITANGNAFAVRGRVGAANRSLFIVDEDGDYHYDGADGGAFDAYQDAQMVRAFATATSKNTLRTAHDDWVQYNEQDLVDIGVLGAPVAEGGLINGAQLQRLHTGAIWQNYTMIADTRTELDQVKSELAEQKALVNTLQKQLGQA